MPLPRRAAARTRLGVAALLAAALLLGVGIVPALARPTSRSSATDLRDWLHRAMRTLTRHDDARLLTPSDTVVVFGPRQAATSTGAAATTVEQFTVPQADAGRRYLL